MGNRLVSFIISGVNYNRSLGVRQECLPPFFAEKYVVTPSKTCYFKDTMAMTIEWLGGPSVVIKGPGDRCFLNPPAQDLGKKKLTDKGGVSLVGYPLPEYSGTYQDPHLIATPGEYDIGGFFVMAVRSELATSPSPNLFIIRYERRSIAYINSYPQEKVSDKDLDTLGSVDILILPLDDGGGGMATMDVAKAVSITNQIDPRVVIPIESARTKKAPPSG